MKLFSKGNAKKLQIVGLLAGIILGIGSMVWTPSAASAAVSFGGPFDCDANAVLYCGAKNASVVANDYDNGVKGTSGSTKINDTAASIRNIYAYFGISSSDIHNLGGTAVAGTVDKDGNVYVGSQLVATGALTAGRQNIAGSTKLTSGGTTFYTRKPSVSFKRNSLTAYVVMQNGKFKFAILSSCGNPVKATPKPPAVGKLVCTELLVTPGKVESNGDQAYSFSAKASATNATISQYTFDFGSHGSTETIKTSAKEVNGGTQIYAPGTYRVGVTVSGVAKNAYTTPPQPATCTKTITIAKPHTPPPASGSLVCSSLSMSEVGVSSTTGDVTYTLTAQATPSGNNVAITKYVFNFGNGTTQTINTSAHSATSQNVTYAAGQVFNNIFATVYGTANGKPVQAGGARSGCSTNLSVPAQTCSTGSQASLCHPTCTAPNGQTYPAGSSQCTPVALTSTQTPPTQLTNTGPGDIIGLFLAASSAAGLAYHFLIGRRLSRDL